MELCLNFRVINYRNFEEVIFKHLYLAEIKLFWCDYNFRPVRIGADVEKIRLVIIGANNVDI